MTELVRGCKACGEKNVIANVQLEPGESAKLPYSMCIWECKYCGERNFIPYGSLPDELKEKL